MARYRPEPLHEPKKKNKKKRWLPTLLGVFVLVLLVGLGYLFRAPSFQVLRVQISGAKVVPEEDIQKVVQESMKGNYFFLIPKTSTFFLDKGFIQKNILQSSLRIKKATLSREGTGGVRVTIVERTAAHTWCQGESSASDSKECYYIDEEGFAFAPAPRFSPGVVFEFFGDTATGTAPRIGTTVIASSSVSFILSFRSALSSTTPVSLLSARSTGDGDYELATLEGPVILLSNRDTAESEAGRLDVFFRSDVFTGPGIQGAVRALKKIDLRFGQKIFYTLSKGASESAGTTTEIKNP